MDAGNASNRAFWLAMRQALLMMVDAIEVLLAIPRTSELRKVLKTHCVSDTIPTA